MLVIWKSVTKAVSSGFGVITRPEVVCVIVGRRGVGHGGLVEHQVHRDGGRGRRACPSTAVRSPGTAVDSCTVKLPVASEFSARRELQTGGSLRDGDELAVG